MDSVERESNWLLLSAEAEDFENICQLKFAKWFRMAIQELGDLRKKGAAEPKLKDFIDFRIH